MATAALCVEPSVDESLRMANALAQTHLEPMKGHVAAAASEDSNTAVGETLVCGSVVRRRKYRDHISLAIRTVEGQPPSLVLVSRSDPDLEGCFLGCVVELALAAPRPLRNAQDATTDHLPDPPEKLRSHNLASRVRVVRSAPDPNAIQTCLRLVVEGRLPLQVFSVPNEETDASTSMMPLLSDAELAKDILAKGPKDPLRRAFVQRLSAGLQGEPVRPWETVAAGAMRPKKRPAHIKFSHRRVLEALERSQAPLLTPIVQPLPPSQAGGDEGGEADEHDTPLSPSSAAAANETATAAAAPTTTSTPNALVYNLPDPHDANLMSLRHPKSRREYLHDKKWPQIRWLIARLRPILDPLGQELREGFLEVLDIGGGRGDLAVAVAEAFPVCRVTVVDLNETSLQGGRAYYQSRKPAHEAEDRVRFVCGDFATYRPSRPFDVVLAWHACGDLSDYALEFALGSHQDNGIHQPPAKAFVVCPCCYTKRYIDAFEPQWIGKYKLQQQAPACIPVPPLAPADEPSAPGASPTIQASVNASSSKVYDAIKTVQRLAEVNEKPEISHRAMGLINTMRLRSLLELSAKASPTEASGSEPLQPTYTITLEEYDKSFSSKNHVLVGVQATRHS